MNIYESYAAYANYPFRISLKKLPQYLFRVKINFRAKLKLYFEWTLKFWPKPQSESKLHFEPNCIPSQNFISSQNRILSRNSISIQSCVSSQSCISSQNCVLNRYFFQIKIAYEVKFLSKVLKFRKFKI